MSIVYDVAVISGAGEDRIHTFFDLLEAMGWVEECFVNEKANEINILTRQAERNELIRHRGELEPGEWT
ncbi:MAG: hypothetical protein HQL95_04545 [Magnetococcales bacterium]|nr:hypothetical protein [Magnetococcales bacterium]